MAERYKKKNERRYRRIPQSLVADLTFLSCSPPASVAQRGVVTDLGAAGIHVLLSTAYHPGSRFEVSTELAGDRITFCVVVRHVHWFSSTPGMNYGHGMQITEIDEQSLYKIVRYLSDELIRSQRGSVALQAA